MSSHYAWLLIRPSRRRRQLSIVLVIAAAVLAGCSAPPAIVVGADPADPGAPIPSTRYRSDIGAYVSQRPSEPRPWGERNERVAPQPRAAE